MSGAKDVKSALQSVSVGTVSYSFYHVDCGLKSNNDTNPPVSFEHCSKTERSAEDIFKSIKCTCKAFPTQPRHIIFALLLSVFYVQAPTAHVFRTTVLPFLDTTE